METPKKPTVHSMKRRSFTHEYSYRGYFHITMSTEQQLRQPLGRVCGDISAPDGDATAPHVELTPFGLMVQQELLTSIKRHYPMVEVDTYVIMPEHLHILLHATRDIFSATGRRTHIGRVIAGFKQGCNRRYWEMTGRIIPATRAEGATVVKEGLVTKSPGAIAAPTSHDQAPTAPPASGPTAPPNSGHNTPPNSGPTTPPNSGHNTPPNSAPTAPPNSGHNTPPNSGPTAPPVSAPTTPLSPVCPPIALNDSVVEPHPAPAPLPPLFEAGYCDVIPVDEAQLATQRAYIRNNPRSRLMRTTNRACLMPRRGGIDTAVSPSAMCGFLQRVCTANQFTPAIWQELQKRFLLADGHICCDSFGNRALLAAHLLPVVCHRKDASLFPTQKARCLEAARNGTILVSPRIAAGEQEIIDTAMALGYPVILIEDNGLTDRYHPSAERLDACAENRLLIVTPWHYLFRKKDDAIHVPFCKAMNCIAQALCRREDEWWHQEK